MRLTVCESQVVARGKQCEGADELFDGKKTLDTCAAACRDRTECEYFLFGIGNEAGKCYMEKNDCSVLTDAEFEVYQYTAPDSSSEYSALIHNARCDGRSRELSNEVTSTKQCADECKGTVGCQHFSRGYGSKEGYCYWELGNCSAPVDNQYDTFQITGAAPLSACGVCLPNEG